LAAKKNLVVDEFGYELEKGEEVGLSTMRQVRKRP
jgi:hypothetical protein